MVAPPRSPAPLHTLLLGVVILGWSFMGTGCQSDSSGSADVRQAPDFEMKTLEGDTFELADHRGDVVVVNFWATWCAPCVQEIPTFIEMQRKFGDDGLQFVGVSLDKQGFEVVRPFAEKMQINYPLVVDDGSLAKEFGGLQGVPTTYVVDTDGQIQHRIEGITTEQHLRSLVDGMLTLTESEDPEETVSDEEDSETDSAPQPSHSSTSS
jgi:cytochrome c biogenesis protein CcmG/thiol:disulfide interchange protein DsbE